VEQCVISMLISVRYSYIKFKMKEIVKRKETGEKRQRKIIFFENKKIKLPPLKIRCKVSTINEWTGKYDGYLSEIPK